MPDIPGSRVLASYAKVSFAEVLFRGFAVTQVQNLFHLCVCVCACAKWPEASIAVFIPEP